MSPPESPSAPAVEPGDSPPAPRSFWQRRLIDPLVRQLRQGVTPRKLAATLAVGTACSLFPFIGFTTGLNLLAGLRFRMNQPLLQTLNYLLTPLHLIMIVVYVRAGAHLWGADADSFTVPGMLASFRDLSFGEFLQQFGWIGIYAFSAWTLSVPAILALIYYPARPAMRRLARLVDLNRSHESSLPDRSATKR